MISSSLLCGEVSYARFPRFRTVFPKVECAHDLLPQRPKQKAWILHVTQLRMDLRVAGFARCSRHDKEPVRGEIQNGEDGSFRTLGNSGACVAVPGCNTVGVCAREYLA